MEGRQYAEKIWKPKWQMEKQEFEQLREENETSGLRREYMNTIAFWVWWRMPLIHPHTWKAMTGRSLWDKKQPRDKPSFRPSRAFEDPVSKTKWNHEKTLQSKNQIWKYWTIVWKIQKDRQRKYKRQEWILKLEQEAENFHKEEAVDIKPATIKDNLLLIQWIGKLNLNKRQEDRIRKVITNTVWTKIDTVL